MALCCGSIFYAETKKPRSPSHKGIEQKCKSSNVVIICTGQHLALIPRGISGAQDRNETVPCSPDSISHQYSYSLIYHWRNVMLATDSILKHTLLSYLRKATYKNTKVMPKLDVVENDGILGRYVICGPRQLSRYSKSLRAGGPRIESADPSGRAV